MGIVGPPNIEKLKARKNVKGLIKALKHKDSEIRGNAANALGEIGDQRAVESLIAALRDSDVRESAATALGNIADARAVEPLIDLLKDKNDNVRVKVAIALAKIKDPRAVEPLIATLKDEHRVRLATVEALGDLGNARAVEPLIQVLKDRDEFIRHNAVEALVKIGDEKALSSLFQVLKEDSYDAREKIVISMGEIGNKMAAKLLIKALKDFDVNIRVTATLVLGKIRNANAVEPLVQVLKDRNENQSFRKCAAKSLGEIGDKKAIDTLIHALKYESYALKPEVAKALGKIGDIQAAEAVIDWLFMAPLEINRKETEKEIKFWSEAMKNLFGDYTDVILKAQMYTHTITIVSYGRHEYHDYDLFIIPLRKLCEINTKISNNILYKVAQKRDIEVKVRYDDCETYEETKYGTLSFEPQREMAKKELERRGNPPYDSSAYLDKEAWKI